MFRRLLPMGGVLGGAAVGWLCSKHTEVSNSWTTNFTPSVAWDWNWDRREPSSLLKPEKKPSQLIDLRNNKENSGNSKSSSSQPLTSSTTSISSSTIATTSSSSNDTDDSKLQLLRSKATRYIILVRHGQYNLDGEKDKHRTLTKLGEEQSRLTGERLKALDLPITRLVHSTMTRAIQTATIMMEHMNPIDEVESCDLIREGAPIPPEPPLGHWRPENHQFFADGPRIESGFRRYFHRAPPTQMEDSYEVLVCHANVIRYIVCRGLQFPPEGWLRMSLHNGSLTVISIRPDGRVGLRQLGECGHMPLASLSLT